MAGSGDNTSNEDLKENVIRRRKRKRILKFYTEEEIQKQGLPPQPRNNNKKKIDKKNKLEIPSTLNKREVLAMPNSISRSALFAPIARGKRIDHGKDSIIPSRNDITITYTGPQLDMADSDIFMLAIKKIKDNFLGDKVFIDRIDFLNDLGRASGGNSYKWLDESFTRLAYGKLKIETVKIKVITSLILKYKLNKETGECYLIFDPDIIKLFKDKQFGLIDLNNRKEIKKRKDLTKWMQNYISSNKKGLQTIGIEKLKFICGQEKRTISKFKASIIDVFKELERLKIIRNFSINKKNVIFYESINKK